MLQQRRIEIMTKEEFKRQIKGAGLKARKQKGLEVFDVLGGSTELFEVSYAEIYHLTDISPLLAKHLRPEYIPPLG